MTQAYTTLRLCSAATAGHLQCQWLQCRQWLSIRTGDALRTGLWRPQLPPAAGYADTRAAGVSAVHRANSGAVGLWQPGVAAANDWARPRPHSTKQQVCGLLNDTLAAAGVLV
jgi:hypothetical protein